MLKTINTNLKKFIRKLPFVVPVKPRTVYWNYGDICNLRCEHCDVWKLPRQGGFKELLTIDQKKIIADKLDKWIGEPYSLNFFAGEIFLHRDIYEIIKYASKSHAVTSVTTNGTLICVPENARKVVESGLDYVSISLDSNTPSFHDKNRGRKGVHDKVLKSISLIKELKKLKNVDKPQIWLNSVIMKNNLDELIELVRFAKKEHLDGIAFQPIASTSFFGGIEEFDHFWYKKSPVWPNYDKVMFFIDELVKMKKAGYPIRNSANDFRRFRSYFLDPVLFGQTEPSDHEVEILVVTQKGELKISLFNYSLGTFGNIFTDDLDKVWRSEAAYRQRDYVSNNTSQSKIIPCKKEDFYFI